ncbi:MAG TPA: hypothetical protein VNK04_14180 [Gemmataceae bacterium]|nr:hypothetical protein [Gemmataceae bacterium]
MSKRRFNHRGGVGCEESFPGSDYTDEEREFLQAIERYKRTRRRPYPTWREVLNVLREIGWRKTQPPAGGAASAAPTADAPSPSPPRGEGEA